MWQTGACYIRVSTDDQTEFSPDAQLKAIKEYAKKNNITLAKQYIYVDEGISGKKAEKRPAFMEMIATAKLKPRPFDVILVHKFDRFARSREDSVVYKSLLKKEAGIKVVSITESIDDDKFSIILEAMLEAMAEYYSINLAEEVKKGMLEKATRGGLQTGAPFGYKVVNNMLEIVPEEATIVKLIFEKFVSREFGYRQLAEYVNQMGIRSHKGCKFENRTIEYILRNPAYIGKLRWTPTGRTRRNFDNPDTLIVESGHQPIVTTELWDKAQQTVAEIKELYPKRQRSTTEIRSWTYGLIKCGNCGKSLVTSVKEYYQCNGYSKGTCKISHAIKIKKVEELLLNQLKQDFSNELDIKIVPKSSDTDKSEEYNFILERLDKCSVKSQRIKEAYQDGIDTKEEYKQNKEALENEIASLNKQLNELNVELKQSESQEKSVYKRIKNTYELLCDDEVELDVKYQAAHFLINKVTYNKQEQTLYIEYK